MLFDFLIVQVSISFPVEDGSKLFSASERDTHRPNFEMTSCFVKKVSSL